MASHLSSLLGTRRAAWDTNYLSGIEIIQHCFSPANIRRLNRDIAKVAVQRYDLRTSRYGKLLMNYSALAWFSKHRIKISTVKPGPFGLMHPSPYKRFALIQKGRHF